MSYSRRVVGGVDYRCGNELWASSTPSQCGRSMVRLAGLGQVQPDSPASEIRTALLYVIGVSAVVGALEGAAIGAIAADRGRRGRGALKGAGAGAVLNAIGLTLIVLPTLKSLGSQA